MRIDYPPGATPLDPDDAAALIPSITTQAELNQFEATNILTARRWAQRRLRILRLTLLTDTELRNLHRRMLGETWRWAGQYRQATPTSESVRTRFPFNGNGRHARLAADLLAMSNGQPAPTWGRGDSLIEPGEHRSEYLAALRESDRGAHARLIRFSRS